MSSGRSGWKGDVEDNEKKRNRQEHSERSRQWEIVDSDEDDAGEEDTSHSRKQRRSRSRDGKQKLPIIVTRNLSAEICFACLIFVNRNDN